MSKTATIQEDWTTKEAILYTTGGIVFLGGSFFLVRFLVKKGIENKEQKSSFEDGTSATYAKGIKMAFENDGWPGTNTKELRRILREISSKEEFEKAVKSYKKLYGSNLVKDMSNELQSSEYSEMLYILASKPQKMLPGGKTVLDQNNYKAWAKRLKAAFEKTYGFISGTDEEAIKAVFTEIPTQAAFAEVAKTYQNENSSGLIDDLKGELEWWEYADYMKIITSKPLN